jgi:hypothetical protein
MAYSVSLHWVESAAKNRQYEMSALEELFSQSFVETCMGYLLEKNSSICITI